MISLPICCLALASLQENQGEWRFPVQIDGPEDQAFFSHAMCSVGDLDGDGVREVLIGAPASDLGGRGSGAAHLYSGRTGFLLRTFVVPPQGTSGNAYGTAVASAGDVDADGFDDIIIGDNAADYHGLSEGAAFVYSGRDGHLIYLLTGSAVESGEFGVSVSGIGDLDFDGFDDFIIGDPGVHLLPNSSGVIWIYSGRDGSVLRQIAHDGAYATGGRVQGISDLNQDGVDEVLYTGTPCVRVMSGADGMEIRCHYPQLPQDGIGSALADVGDVDQDGTSDYALGAPDGWSGGLGRVYVYSGASGVELFRLEGYQDRGDFGEHVAGPGDVDGDGFPEILVGAASVENNQFEVIGAAYLFSGFDGRRIATFSAEGTAANRIGFSVASPGDVDNDGLADLLIGSASSTAGMAYNGVVRTYALHSYLNLSARTVSAGAGGTIDFQLDFPDSDASKQYMLLASGGVPGRTRVLDHWIPLARTPLLDLMVRNPPGFIAGANGTLDTHGNATATATLAPAQAAAWVGRTLKFVAVSFDAPNDISLYSAAMSLTIEP